MDYSEEESVQATPEQRLTLENGRYFKQEDYEALKIEVGKLISIVSNRYELDDEVTNITYTLQEVLEIPESVHYTVYEWLEQLI